MNRIFIIVIIATLFSCKKKTAETITYGYDYFPTTEGLFRVYEVTDIFHDLALEPAHDTNRYQIKEVIAESLVDNEGDTIQKIKRYIRTSDTLDWAIQDVWTQKRTPTTAEVVEENDRFIKLIFAIAYERTWDCNALNDEEERECYYENIYLPYALGNMNFDSTLIVEKQDFISFIDFKRQYEVYARNIGKIQSIYKDLEIDNFDTLDIQKGAEITYTLIDYGVE